MIRQPIARGWYVALGVSSFITLGGLYTILSLTADTKLVPTWQQIYSDGFVPVFLPRTEELPYFAWLVTVTTKQGESIKGELVTKDSERVVLTIPGGATKTIRSEDVVASKGELDKTWKDRFYPPLIWIDGRATLWRLVSALVMATLLGVPLGLLMGCYHGVEAYFLPPLSFLAKIPATAMLAVFMVSCPTVSQFYWAIIIFGLIPTLAQTIFRAAKEDVPDELLFKARTLGAGQFDCVWDVILKYILPNVMEVVRLLIGPAVVYLMAAEWARGEDGFGCRMRLMMKSLDMSITYTYLIVLGVGGLVVDNALVWLRRKLFPWYAAQ